MTDDRVARGRRVLGHRRLCAYLAATLALMLCGALTAIAEGASGGAGTGSPTPVAPITPITPTTTTTPTPSPKPASSSPLSGRGMWIWELPNSDGGSVPSIIAHAHRYGIKTLLIKSGDGSSTWSQFSSGLVSTLHANGLRACAWQYVYGSYPASEARVGAAAVARGADCLVIDAESQYEGKYVQAQRYITTLRKLIGPRFPVALASFPYVDYHPAFPFSVFLGPGGAQYNAPQMYWLDIGTTVDDAYAHTYVWNRVYGQPIRPLGQIYNHPPARDIMRFRELSLAYGAKGLSWWDWQESSAATWRALAQPLGTLANFTPDISLAHVGRGALGDLVVWAQEHLVSAGQPLVVDGSFGPKTQRAVKYFQSAHGISATGRIDAATWKLLLRYAPAVVHWTLRSSRTASAATTLTSMPVPKNASARAVRNEIAGAGGAGAPRRRR